MLITNDDGERLVLSLFVHDRSVLEPLGIIWPKPDPEAVDIETLPPSDTPTTDRVAIVPELAEAVA